MFPTILLQNDARMRIADVALFRVFNIPSRGNKATSMFLLLSRTLAAPESGATRWVHYLFLP